jgi:tetratricopeptide (TPR) repeat protein
MKFLVIQPRHVQTEGCGTKRSAAILIAASVLWTSHVLPAAEPVFQEFTNGPATTLEPEPTSTRERFNLGTRQLRSGKLGEAETRLQQVLASQEARFQGPAAYNLGHARFAQGIEHLKKSQSAGAMLARSRSAVTNGDQATAQAREALGGNDVQRMIDAYLNGRGARRELKAATLAVRRALDFHGAALRKWQRSLDDFKSAAELNPSDTNALYNAQLVEREIARLVDSIREMQQAAQNLANSQRGLQEQMKQLGGRIPEPMMPPGAAEGDEEDEDGENGEKEPPEPKPGRQENPSRDGEEMTMTSEEAGWILEGFKLDSERRLPMGGNEPAKPRDPKGRNW